MSESQPREEDQRKRNWAVWVWGGVCIIFAVALFADWYPVIKFASQKAQLEHIAAIGRKWGAVQSDLIAAGYTIEHYSQYHGYRKQVDLRYRTPTSKRVAVMILQLWRTQHFPRWYETLNDHMTFVISLNSADTVESINYDAFIDLGS